MTPTNTRLTPEARATTLRDLCALRTMAKTMVEQRIDGSSYTDGLRLLALLDESDADKARIAELEEALRPFAELWANWEPWGYAAAYNIVVSSRLGEDRQSLVGNFYGLDLHIAAAVLARTTRESDARDQGGRSGRSEADDGWRPIASAPKGKKVIVRCGPTVDVAYLTDNEPPLMNTWRHAGSENRGRQLGYWPDEWMPLPAPPSPDAADASVKTAEA